MCSEGRLDACRKDNAVLASNPEIVATSIRNNHDGSISGKIFCPFKKGDGWLKNSAATADNTDPARKLRHTHVALVIGSGVRKNHAYLSDIFRRRIGSYLSEGS